jgi:hypothetical protein
LISGDAVIGSGSIDFEDLDLFMNSLAYLSTLEIDKIYPGKGPVIDDPLAKIQDLIDHRRKRENEIMKLLASRPMKIEEITNEIYKNHDPIFIPRASRLVSLHLKKLIREEIVLLQGSHFTLI